MAPQELHHVTELAHVMHPPTLPPMLHWWYEGGTVQALSGEKPRSMPVYKMRG